MMSTRKKPKQQSKELLEQLLERGDRQEIRALFAFDSKNSIEEILFKFRLWSRWFFYKFYSVEDAEFHDKIDRNNLNVYLGFQSIFLNIGFRGCAKTSRTKLFRAFVVTNDVEHRRKYLKVATKDLGNAKQIVTDVYNMVATGRVRYYYPEVFEKTEEKREETMGSFTTSTGIKLIATTVGMDHRGQLQDESRPDEVWYEDFETRNTLRSAVLTETIWNNMEEARTGLARGGGCIYTCNYVSERGNVHRLVQKYPENTLITPIRKNNKPTWPQAYTMKDIETIEKNAEDFAGEYLCEPSAGADVFFDRSCLDRQVKKVPIKVVGEFKIFHKYDPSHRYGAGQDIGGGVGLDHTASVFIDFSTMPNRVVATFKNNYIKPDTFGYELIRQGDMYGQCLLAPENNKFDMVIGVLKHQSYPNIYFTEDKETRAGMPPRSRTYGWNTNAMSKPKMMFELKKGVEDGLLELSDPDLIFELRSYSRDDLMDRDDDPRLTTRHFDLLTACAIAWQMKLYAQISRRSDALDYKQPDFQRSGIDD